MTYLSSTKIEASDSASIDAFGRWRVSAPVTLFDSKQLWDADPLFWDDAEASGSGTSSTHSVYTASTVMAVGASTAGSRVRQTFQRFNYQAGKSHLIMMTGVMNKSGGGTGITRRFGYFDSSNGIFLEDAEGVISLVVRSSVSGSPSDVNKVAQASWNIDPMDGSGPSGVTIDWSKAQILLIEMEWLGAGRALVGFVIDGSIYYVHQFLNANNISSVYMSNPNLPLRWEITNDGSGVSSSLEHICGTVMVEGGAQDTGLMRSASTKGTHLDANVADVLYALIGIGLKSTHLNSTVTVHNIGILNETADFYEWELILNPTVAGTFTYSAESNSPVEVAIGATANTVTGGYLLQAGWGNKEAAAQVGIVEVARSLGSSIVGTSDRIVLCVRSRASNADFNGSITWRESR